MKRINQDLSALIRWYFKLMSKTLKWGVRNWTPMTYVRCAKSAIHGWKLEEIRVAQEALRKDPFDIPILRINGEVVIPEDLLQRVLLEHTPEQLLDEKFGFISIIRGTTNFDIS